jgi:geranylgeranyl diphosphate synthase, type II
MGLNEYLAERAALIDKALDDGLPKASVRPAVIHRAMRHSVFAGGKRLRPILCLAAAEACGGTIEAAMPAACAVELLHTYSLVHDDLPAMDDDDLRRGRPTCHKVFGEAIGILCGDALLTESFAVLANAQSATRYSVAAMVRELATAGDSRHMIGGQVLDLEGENQPATRASLKRIHEAKTAALLTASLRLGAMSANATPRAIEALTRFGQALGLAFQVIDDILDETATTEQLGKTAGKDAAAAKATYPAVIGLEASQREAAKLTRAAHTALDGLPKKHTARLREIAKHLLGRNY